ncbi:MAG: hypothetical protein FWD68_04725 [Alphaproteobacteria bacterium]|nr:hypothetical protein [Alphaproteobacteria bacterium]
MATKFDPAIHDDNPPMTEDFMAGMKASKRGHPKSDGLELEGENPS